MARGWKDARAQIFYSWYYANGITSVRGQRPFIHAIRVSLKLFTKKLLRFGSRPIFSDLTTWYLAWAGRHSLRIRLKYHCASISLNCTIHGIEIHLFRYIIYSKVMGNENGLLTWSIPIIISYDAISSNKWLPVTCWLVFSTVLTGSRLGPDWFYRWLIV